MFERKLSFQIHSCQSSFCAVHNACCIYECQNFSYKKIAYNCSLQLSFHINVCVAIHSNERHNGVDFACHITCTLNFWKLKAQQPIRFVPLPV